MAADLTQGASHLGLCVMRNAAPLLNAVLVAVDLTAQVLSHLLAPKKQNFAKDSVAMEADDPTRISLNESLEVVALAMVDVDLVDPVVHLAVLMMTVLLDSA